MKKTLSLLLVFAMLLCMLAACGSSSSSTSSSTTTSSTTTEESTAEATAEAAAEETTTEAAATETASAEQPAAEAEAAVESSSTGISLPLTEETVTYTIWYSEPFTELVDDPAEDLTVFRLLAENTNIQLEFTICTNDTASEKFMLMFAADALTDIITDAMQYYSGSIDDAVYEDAFLLDYSSYLSSMPNYSAVLDAYPEAKQTITSATSGAMVSFPEIYESTGDMSGYMIREDYLEMTGMDVPTTYDELHELLVAIHNETGATLELASTGGDGILGAGFGINVSLDDEDLSGWYLDDGEVKLGLLQDEFKDYLELVIQWYNEGLIYVDFINTDRGDLSELFAGDYAICVRPPDICTAAENVLGTSMVGMASPKLTEDQQLTICGSATSCLMDTYTWSINVEAENPELILALIDYMYSDEGYILINYGEEGVSYTLDAEGNPQFTDLILNNEEGLTYAQAAYLYASSNRTRLPFVSYYERCFAQYSDNQWGCIETWTGSCDHSCDYPLGAIMTTEQQAQYNTVAADIVTYVSENVLKFIYGQKDMSEWDSFIEEVYGMGVETAIAAKQAAYDDYLAS